MKNNIMTKKPFHLFFALCLAFLAVPVSSAQAQQPDIVCGIAPGETEETYDQSFRCHDMTDQDFQRVEPIKVFDNLYYVGPAYVAAWLLTTPDGLILFDGADERYADHVISGIRAMGYDPADIRYIFISHGHFDHFAGVPAVQEIATNARVGATGPDWELIERAATEPNFDGGPSPATPDRDMVIGDGMEITVGGETITLYQTPGHTPGVLSAAFTVYDNGMPHKAFLWGGPGEFRSPESVRQGLDSANRIAQIPDIEVGIMIHSWLNTFYPYPNGSIFTRARTLADRQPGDPHPFVDPESWQEFVSHTQNRLNGIVESQQ